jgi:glycosyltransferase involved in cell wall biosynthesis
MKRILLIGDINSAHFQRWAMGIQSRGFSVGIWSLELPKSDWYSANGIQYFPIEIPQNRFAKKLKYILFGNKVKKAIADFKPDIVHAHYASGYGVVLRKSGFHPSFLSVWGSDVMDFPNRNKWNAILLKKNLNYPDRLFATSPVLKQCVSDWSGRNAEIISFGVDTHAFSPGKKSVYFNATDLVFGTVKTLAPIYGIDIFIKAFAKLKTEFPDLPLKLLIAGQGSDEASLKSLAASLLDKADFCFPGKIPFEEISNVHQEIDVFVNVSRNESFGVAVLEASASGKPVIVSNVGGLTGVVVEGSTGWVVQVNDVDALVNAMKEALDTSERIKRGKMGRSFVEENYQWSGSLDQMCNAYLET